jgi:hypothetical protein
MKKRALVRLDRFFGSFSQNQLGFGKNASLCFETGSIKEAAGGLRLAERRIVVLDRLRYLK